MAAITNPTKNSNIVESVDVRQQFRSAASKYNYKDYHVDKSLCLTTNSLKMAKKEVLQQLKSDLRPSKKNLMFLVRISAKKQGSGAF